MSSWTPPPPQQLLHLARSRRSTSRSNERSQDLLGNHPGPWWPLTETHQQQPLSDYQDLAAASISCPNNDLFSPDFSADNSPTWPLPLQDFVIFDQTQSQPIPLAPLPTSVGTSLSASPEDLSFGLSALFPEQHHEQDQSFHDLLQQHCQNLLDPSSTSVTPASSTLDGQDMTLVGLFEGVNSEHGLGQHGAGSGHRHSHHTQGLVSQGRQNFMSSGPHVLPHPHQDALSLHGTAATFSHDKTTADSAKHTLLTTSSASSTASSSTAPQSLRQHPSQPKPYASPDSNGSTGSKRKHAASSVGDLDPDSEDAQVAIKRHRNTMAARKYRQKRLDRISDLEQALGEVTGERDELKLQLARREAEVAALREMLSKK